MQQYTYGPDHRVSTSAPSGILMGRLTAREGQVALLVANGLKNRSIAQRLTLSPATVATYVQRIQSRLGLSGRDQIAAWVAERPTAGHRDVIRR